MMPTELFIKTAHISKYMCEKSHGDPYVCIDCPKAANCDGGKKALKILEDETSAVPSSQAGKAPKAVTERKYRTCKTQKEREALIQKYMDSGLTQKEFCRKENVNYCTFRSYMTRTEFTPMKKDKATAKVQTPNPEAKTVHKEEPSHGGTSMTVSEFLEATESRAPEKAASIFVQQPMAVREEEVARTVLRRKIQKLKEEREKYLKCVKEVEIDIQNAERTLKLLS